MLGGRTLASVAGAVAVAAALATPAFADTSPADPAATPPALVKLSDEHSLSRWAHPAWTSAIYADHTAKSRKLGKIRFFTEDGFPEVYLLLSQYTDSRDNQWVEIRIPKRPNGGVGWVPRESLGPYNVNRFRLVIDRKALTARLFKSGKVVWSARVGVGTTANATPAGRFWVREKFRFKEAPVYGKFAIGTAAYAPHLSDWPNGGVVGIHGTDQPQLIPGRPSHGCIRLKNPDIERLWKIVQLGTPVWIR